MDKKMLISFIILPILLIYLVEGYFVQANLGIPFVIMSSRTFIFSIIIYYCIFMIGFAITKRTDRSILIFTIMVFTFFVVNQIKIAYTNEPIVFSDILYLKNSDELIGIVNGTVWETLKYYIPITIIYILIFICINIVAIKFNVKTNSAKFRIFWVIIPIIILLLIFLPFNKTKEIMLKHVYQTNKRKDYAANTTNILYYLNNGVLAGMYGQMLENRISIPEDYNEEIIKENLEIDQEQNNKKFGKPNIIVVFSESFWDIEKLDEIKFDKVVTSNLNNLKQKGDYFEMISPSFGGVSANVEFEFLTGANLMYFNYGYVPYMQLYRNKTYYNRPSIISELKNNGYKTAITTCASEKLFDCGRFYRYLGVDETEFITEVDESEIKGKYISDEAVTNKIINKLEQKDENERIFYMALTMQAHMPYKKEKYDNYDLRITKSDLSQEMNDTMLSYAQGIYDADKQLGRLYEYIQTIDEPTIIVFYGDHLPYLNTVNGENVFDALKYFNTNNELINEYRKYNTQALILSNFETEKENETKYIGPDLLSAYILNNMNINISSYYKWLYTTRKDIPAANWKIAIDNEGNIYNTNEMKDDMYRLYKLRRNIQYKYFIK